MSTSSCCLSPGNSWTHWLAPPRCGTTGTSCPQWGLPDRCQSPLHQRMELCAYALHLLQDQCHVKPVRHFHTAARGHGQHTVTELLPGLHPARVAHSWLWVPPACNQGVGNTVKLAQEPLFSESHCGVETSPTAWWFSGQIALSALLWRPVIREWGPILLQEGHLP